MSVRWLRPQWRGTCIRVKGGASHEATRHPPCLPKSMSPPPQTHPAAGSATVVGADAGDGLPLPSTPLAVTLYVAPAARPVRVHPPVAQDRDTGLPPPAGVAVTK